MARAVRCRRAASINFGSPAGTVAASTVTGLATIVAGFGTSPVHVAPVQPVQKEIIAQMTTEATPAAAGPSFLEKLGAAALDYAIPIAKSEETYILAFVDGEIAAGSTSGGTALVKALTSKIPIIGGVIAADIESELGPLDTTVDGWVKSGYDQLIALLQAKAKSWGG